MLSASTGSQRRSRPPRFSSACRGRTETVPRRDNGWNSPISQEVTMSWDILVTPLSLLAEDARREGGVRMNDSHLSSVAAVNALIQELHAVVRGIADTRVSLAPDGPADDVRRVLSQELGELVGLRSHYPEAVGDIDAATRNGITALQELGAAVARARLDVEVARSRLLGPAVRRAAAGRIWRQEAERYRKRVSHAPAGCREFHAMQAYFTGLRDVLRAEVLKGTAIERGEDIRKVAERAEDGGPEDYRS